MNAFIQQILVTLQDLLDLNRQLIAYGNEKREAIVANNVEAVSQLSGREKKCVQQVLDLEQKRIFLIGKYAVEQGLPVRGTYKMEKLIQIVYHAEEKVGLQNMWKELSAALKELQDVNDFNQQLIRMNLKNIHFMQDLLLGPTEDEVTYHRAVQGMAQNRSSRFNAKM